MQRREHLLSEIEEAESPTDMDKDHLGAVAKRVFSEIKDDRVPAVSAGLAFYGVIAVFPALIALISVYGLFTDPIQVQDQISAVSDMLPEGAGTVISSQLRDIAGQTSNTLIVTLITSLLGALWSASSGAQHLILAINQAYDEEESRGFVALRGMAVLLTIGFVILGVISLALIVVIPPLLDAVGLASGTEILIGIGRFAFLAFVLIATLTVIYRISPDRATPKWRWVMPGAVIATVIWIAASILFSIYVAKFGSYDETYGSLAGGIILMFWMFISAFVVLVGAEINAELEFETEADSTSGDDQPMGRRGAVKADTTPDEVDEARTASTRN